jgi:hypothetical protein
MMASLLRAPPRKAVRKYVLVELKRVGRRMDHDELVDLISCPGYDHDGKACAKHGKDRCGALEWVTDVDAGGNIIGKWERKLGVATRYEVYVAIGSLIDSGRIEIVEGQLRYQRHTRAHDALTPEERWRRADEEIRTSWQTMLVKETRCVWGREE